MVNLGANLYNALPQSLLGANRLTASNFSLQEADESAQGGNSLRLLNQQYRQQAGLPDFSPPPKGQQGFASLGPVLERFQPEITPLHELPGPTSWERLLEEQKRISAAREQAARDFENLLNRRKEAQAELEERLQLVKENADRARLDVEPDENIPGPETDDEGKISNAAQQALNSQRSSDDETQLPVNAEVSQRRSEAAPLPGQGTRIEDPYQPEDEGFKDQSVASEKPLALPGSGSSSEQQQVARLFRTSDNTGNAINFFA